MAGDLQVVWGATHPRDPFPSPGHDTFSPEARALMVLRGGSLAECTEAELLPRPMPAQGEPVVVSTPKHGNGSTHVPTATEPEATSSTLVVVIILVMVAIIGYALTR